MHNVSSLYVHFPFCRHLCNYCDFFKVESAGKIEYGPFHSYLIRSAAELQKFFIEQDVGWLPLETLYLGGGTPSLWNSEGAIFFSGLLNSLGIVKKDEIEFTMEINPGTLDSNSIKTWRNIGLNRYSVGLQSLDEKYLKHLDRFHSLNDSFNTLEQLRGENFSVDFMIGIPHSQKNNRSIREELLRALEYSPKHFSVYILTTKENYKMKQYLPAEDFVAEEYMTVCEVLKEAGFKHYEVSNFSLPGFESKHNLKYWRGESVAALGPSATGLLRRDNISAIRYKWKPHVPLFQVENLNEKQIKLEDLYLRMRLANPLDYRMYLEESDWSVMEGLLEKWFDHSYIERSNDGRFWLTSEGMLHQDGLLNEVFIHTKTL